MAHMEGRRLVPMGEMLLAGIAARLAGLMKFASCCMMNHALKLMRGHGRSCPISKEGYFPKDEMIKLLKIQQQHKPKSVVRQANSLITELRRQQPNSTTIS